MRDEDGGNLRSVRRAVTALELIAEAGELGVSELGRRLDVHKATASRLVSTLAERGLLERDPVNEKYRLGFGLVRLAGAAMAGLDIVREAHPVLEGLAERTRETVEPRRHLRGLRGVHRSGHGYPLGGRRELDRSQDAAALHLERQGAAGVRAA